MASAASALSAAATPREASDFRFPYAAYDIQLQFMRYLYEAIDNDRIGIFESPTGTGKSLSVICGALTWLVHNSNGQLEAKRRAKEQQAAAAAAAASSASRQDSEPSWVIEQTKKRQREDDEFKQAQDKERESKRKKRVEKYKKNRKKFFLQVNSSKSAQDDDADLVVDYDSDEEMTDQSMAIGAAVSKAMPVGLRAGLMQDLFSSSSSDDEGDGRSGLSKAFDDNSEDEDEEHYYTPKVIYCSRTHSQLNQFVQELKKTAFAKEVRVVSLGSRKTLCIHPRVSKLSSLNRINEACLDMKNKSSAKDKLFKCNFYDIESQKLFKDHALLKLRDIEELVQLGRRIEACPYFGGRRGVPQAQLITMPYSSLVHKQTRESLGISSLKDTVVIIDEAHNLVDAIVSAHGAQLTLDQLNQVHGQLSRYLAKYKLRLNPKNQSRIKQVLSIMKNLHNFFGKPLPAAATAASSASAAPGTPQPTVSRLMTLNDFLFETELDNINMLSIVDFLENSELSRKLNGFVDKYEKQQQQQEASSLVGIHAKQSHSADPDAATSSTASTDGIYAFVAMLQVLSNLDKDGRIIHQSSATNPSIRFVLLNPGIYFQDIVREAKSVILTGGTMEPIDSLVSQLFPGSRMFKAGAVVPLPSQPSQQKDITLFQCGHVIPDDHLLPICLGKSPSGADFDFTFSNRSQTTIDELGKLVISLSEIVPDGIVCFFPSYSYEQQVYDRWTQQGIIRRLEQRKKFFREPKSSSNIDSVLNDYKFYIDTNYAKSAGRSGSGSSKLGAGGASSASLAGFQGSFLSCVVGGKMSEGINFSDGYGRLVIVVGMPYPNLNDVELKEKMKYLDANLSSASSTGQKPSQDYYENLCMKAVNQSIGRSIRHAQDYASILLVDSRWNSKPKNRARLPQWIQRRLLCANSSEQALNAMRSFFASKSELQKQAEETRRNRVTIK